MLGAAAALVVDDDEIIGRTVERALRRAGWSVTRAQTYRGGVNVRGRFECAVLDIDLPDGNGVDLALELLELGLVERVVFHSASKDPTLMQRIAAIGPLVVKELGTDVLMLLVGCPGGWPPRAQSA